MASIKKRRTLADSDISSQRTVSRRSLLATVGSALLRRRLLVPSSALKGVVTWLGAVATARL